ncbi:ATP-binding protein [Streptomyces sp. NPDC015139]|uniref:ATP-binding protein n=1 Tax=Streptomyces sp. NPDC015139 TaxID=3364942 RepID=UPI0037022FD7
MPHPQHFAGVRCSGSWPAAAEITVYVRGTADAVIPGAADDGHGIAREDRERIFEQSVRLDEARSRDDGGTGLGLAIARHVVHASGGDITLRPAPGTGLDAAVRLRPVNGGRSGGAGIGSSKSAQTAAPVP